MPNQGTIKDGWFLMKDFFRENKESYWQQILKWLCLFPCKQMTRVHALKAMAPHSSNLAWKIPWMEEPGRLQSMGSLGVGHDWVTSLSLFTFMHWRRKWQPTPVFLPGESQGWWSLVGCCLWGCTESDMTEATQQQQQQHRLVGIRKDYAIQIFFTQNLGTRY